MKRLVSFIVAAILITGLLAGCGGGKTLRINADEENKTYEFIDDSTNSKIEYQTLQYNGEEIIHVSVGLIPKNGDISYLYIAYEESHIPVINGSSISYKGGTGISTGIKYEYTLEDGVLNLITPEQ
jgi:hypothetical protein